jgi:glycosyltransferase involved in cell wall biosynthesis
MRIVISDAGREWRGTESVTWQLAPGLRALGHDVVVFCIKNSPLQHRLAAAGLPYEPILGGSDLNPRVLLRCWRALSRHSANIVITQKDKDLRWTGLVARLRGVPVLVRHVTDRPLKRKLRYRFFFGWVATHHVANSASTLATLVDSAPWLRGVEIPIVHNGIDVERFANAEPSRLELPKDAITVGYAGRFETRKGIADFAAAWCQIADALPHAHAVIVGDGPRAATFHKALAGAPRVHWLGFRDDIERILKRFDIFVLPSHFEGFGLVLAEAMAAGAACIAYNTSNLPELIEHQHDGILVPPRDTAALTAAVIQLGRCPELRRKLACHAQRKVRERFSADRMIAAYEALAARAARSS